MAEEKNCEPELKKENVEKEIVKKKQSDTYPFQLTDDEWKEKLGAQEYNVLRKKATEPATTGEYDKHFTDKGHYVCRGCGKPLYSAKSKYDSGSGWPAFDMCYKGTVDSIADNSFGWNRVEVLCSNCGGHLGHVFTDGKGRTDHRHCVNSVSIKYIETEPPNEYEEETLALSKSTAKSFGQSEKGKDTMEGCLVM